MLQQKTQKRISQINLRLIIVVSLAFSGCTGTDISYISRSDLKNPSFNSERPGYIGKKPLEFGAIRFVDKDAPEGSMGRVFILKRKNGAYMAETKMKGDGKKRYFFSIGINSRSKMPAVGFRMEF